MRASKHTHTHTHTHIQTHPCTHTCVRHTQNMHKPVNAHKHMHAGPRLYLIYVTPLYFEMQIFSKSAHMRKRFFYYLNYKALNINFSIDRGLHSAALVGFFTFYTRF